MGAGAVLSAVSNELAELTGQRPLRQNNDHIRLGEK